MMPAWSDPESKKQAEALWRQGVSARNIAKQFEGATRNAVAGYMNRNGIKTPNTIAGRRNNEPRRKHPEKPSLKSIAGQFGGGKSGKPARRKTTRKLPPPPADVINDGAGVALLDLKSRQCRWPVSGTGAETRFCGAALNSDRPAGVPDWCDAHCQMGTVPRRKSAPKGARRALPPPRFAGGF